MKCFVIFLALIFSVVSANARDFASKKATLDMVSAKLVSAFNFSIGPAEIRLISTNSKQKHSANFNNKPTPVINIDEKLFNLCMDIGEDSLKALAFILGHELAHHYYDHIGCRDYALAIRSNDISFEKERELQEREADRFGCFYASLAGYDPYYIHERLINKLYKADKLPDLVSGYPSRIDRIRIAQESAKNMSGFSVRFKKGLDALKKGNYDVAIWYFNGLTLEFPSREIYYNLGISKALKANQLRKETEEEKEDSAKYYYPDFQIEQNSRIPLHRKNTKGLRSPAKEKVDFESLLHSASLDLEKAISIDRSYEKCYLSLAIVYDWMKIPESSIGILKMLPRRIKPLAIKSHKDYYQIIAMGYFHADNIKKAEEMFKLASEL